MKIKVDHRWWWVALGGLTILLRFLLQNAEQFVETYYSRGLFLWIRTLLDWISAILPIPGLYVLLLLALLMLLKSINRLVKSKQGIGEKVKNSLLSIFAFLGGFIFLFQLCWGFNYSRVALEKQIGIVPKPMKLDSLRIELEQHAQITMDFRSQIPSVDSTSIEKLPEDLRHQIRTELEKVLKQLGYPDHGQPRVRLLRPKGVLLRISTAGFYLPFTGECNVDEGLHALQLPFVTAHEFAHAYGITDEGSCNFLAYLACTQSQHPFIRYSGQLSYYRYLAGSYLSFKPKEYTLFRENLSTGMVADLNAINQNGLKYPDILPELRDLAYDSYLKSQGIEEGLESYSRIIMLVKAWEDAQAKK